MDVNHKILFVGDAQVGKTNIINKYIGNSFVDQYNPTFGANYYFKKIIIDNKEIKLEIIDTAGVDEYKLITKKYYENTDCVILVFDITQKKSFDNVSDLIKETKKYVMNTIPFIIIGNKYDCKSVIDTDNISELICVNRFLYYKISTKQIKINELNNIFLDCVRQIRNSSPFTEQTSITTDSCDDSATIKNYDNESTCECCAIL